MKLIGGQVGPSPLGYLGRRLPVSATPSSPRLPQAILLFEDEQSWQQARLGGEVTPEACPQLGDAVAGLGAEEQLAAARALCERADAELRAGRDVAAVRLYTRALASIIRQPEVASLGCSSSNSNILRQPEAASLGCSSGNSRAEAGSIEAGCLELNLRLLNSRSAALMRQDDCAGALADAERALSACSPSSAAAASASVASPLATLLAECQYRKALALLLLQRPAEALQAATSNDDDDAATARLRLDAECMLAEQRYGRYDLAAMEAEAAEVSKPGDGRLVSLSRRRHADFESAGIRVEDLGGAKGRTVVACSPLPAGSLIMAARAFAFVAGRVQPAAQTSSPDDDGNGEADGDTDTGALLPFVVRQLVLHPERGAQLYGLSGGDGYEAGGSGDTTRVDVLRIAHILVNK